MARRSLLLVPLLLPTLLSGQALLVVDEAGGPGSHYRDLPQAVAAAPQGAHLLVRPGDYSFFQVSGKALHIRGSGTRSTRVNANSTNAQLSIAAVPAGRTFVLEELEVKGDMWSWSIPAPAPILRLGTGRFLLEQIKVSVSDIGFFPVLHGRGLVEATDSVVHASGLEISGSLGSSGNLPAALHATDCLLQFHRCRISGLWSQGANSPSMHGQAGLQLLRSTAELFHCQVIGGQGSDQSHTLRMGGDGGPGVVLEPGSLLLVDGGTIRGGAKGVVRTMWVYPGLHFGDGMEVRAGAAARLRGATLAPGGAGAQRWTGAGVFQEFGPPLNRPELRLTRTATFPDGLSLRLEGAQGRLVVLAASARPFWMPLGPLGLEGTLHLDLSNLFFLGAFTTPAVLNIPPGPLPAVLGPWWLQTFMAPDGAQTVASNPVHLSLWP